MPEKTKKEQKTPKVKEPSLVEELLIKLTQRVGELEKAIHNMRQQGYQI